MIHHHNTANIVFLEISSHNGISGSSEILRLHLPPEQLNVKFGKLTCSVYEFTF
jgi:hypothetical protein